MNCQYGWSGLPGIVSGGGGVVHSLELIDRSSMEQLEIFADYWPRVGISHAMGGTFPVASDQGVVTMTRSRRDREFDDRDKRRLEILVPHLQRAVQIQRRLAAAEQRSALSRRERQWFRASRPEYRGRAEPHSADG